MPLVRLLLLSIIAISYVPYVEEHPTRAWCLRDDTVVQVVVGYMIGGSGFDLNPHTHWEWLGRAKLSYMEATLNK